MGNSHLQAVLAEQILGSQKANGEAALPLEPGAA